MNIDSFIKITHDEVDQFKKYYLAERAKAKNKSDWPLNQKEVDWYEQYIAWQDMGRPTGEEEETK